MAIELTDEQEALRAVVRDFAQREIAPHAERWDRDHVFPVEVVAAMGELGLFGIPFPDGVRRGRSRPRVAVRGHRGVGPGGPVDGHHRWRPGVGLGANPIYRFGTEDQRQRGCRIW